jgi:formylmethanofuran dehydrogenase subunit E-like metal-binding protein
MSDAYKIFRQIQEKAEKSKKYNGYEKEDLIDEIIELQESEEQLKYRIDKAIEMLEYKQNAFSTIFSVNDVIEILKGKRE